MFTDTMAERTSTQQLDQIGLWLYYVDPDTSNPRLANGYLGRNRITAIVDYDDVGIRDGAVARMVVRNGVPYVIEPIDFDSEEDNAIGLDSDLLPLDAGDITFTGAGDWASGFGVASPAWVETTSTAGVVNTAHVVEYGWVGNWMLYTTVFYGHQLFNFFNPFYTRLMVLEWFIAEPGPAPFTIELLAEHQPADTYTVLDTKTYDLDYRGPDAGWRWVMPRQWILDLADGLAGGLAISPGDTTDGISRVAVGTGGSLSIGPLQPTETITDEGSWHHA